MFAAEPRPAAGGGRLQGSSSGSSDEEDETESCGAGRRHQKPGGGGGGGGERLQKASRKIAKPIMEKRRRARINASLNELKALLVEVLQSEGCRHSSKMEKADILEMTVKHLRQLQRQHASAPSQREAAGSIDKYALGYNECLNKVCNYLHTAVDPSKGVDADFAIGLVNHLVLRMRKSVGGPAPGQQRALELLAPAAGAERRLPNDADAAVDRAPQQLQRAAGVRLQCGGTPPSPPETGPGTLLLAAGGGGGGMASVDDYCRVLPRAFVLSRLHGLASQACIADRPHSYGGGGSAEPAAARAAAAASQVEQRHKIVVPVPTVLRGNPLAGRESNNGVLDLGPSNNRAAAAAAAEGGQFEELSLWRPW